MVFSLLDRLKKNSERGEPVKVTPDLSRLNLQAVADPRASVQVLPEMQAWLERDLKVLTETWQAFSQNPSRENWTAFSKGAHNIFGASGAYGGGALTRLTENLQRLLTNQVNAIEHKALVNLHVQACKAWALGNGGARTTLAEAVCDALEVQVRRIV